MFGIAGTAELSTFCPGTGTWNRLQDGKTDYIEDGKICLIAAKYRFCFLFNPSLLLGFNAASVVFPSF